MNFIPTPPPGTLELLLLMAIITMLMNSVGKEIVESSIKFILRPFNWLSETIYCYIAPRNPLSIAIRSYKKHVLHSNLTKIENPVGPSLTVPLEQAFAPLKLVSDNLQQGVDLFNHVATNHRTMVLGGPGTGKTTLMKSLVTSILKDRCHPDLNALIPVFIVLRNLAKHQYSVKAAIIAAFADYHFPGAEQFVESALAQGKLLIVCDGLDEVGTNRDFVVAQIQEFCAYDDQQDTPNTLLVTCREHAYSSKDLHAAIAHIVRVEPFANHHMRIFLKGWPEHKGRNAIHLYALIQADAQIRDICRNPLLLTILTGLYLDTDNFKLPTSRDQFYQNAVDELLVQRPARRQMTQNYDVIDKRKILERVALDHLESIVDYQDAEEFSFVAIAKKAAEVLSDDKIDCRALIKELVEINGILKPTQEDNYTLAHRTIQEYLAAKEAGRTRTANDVVNRFGNRPDLIEVLYFYCGQLKNIPALTGIVQTFIQTKHWLEAGRCLLNAGEIVEVDLIMEVTDGLDGMIAIAADSDQSLALLASLSQRTEAAFVKPREQFVVVIDYLAGHQEFGASALESALAASPDLAMKVIPGLLKHPSERWKKAAIRLLRDIGSDEALDKLVGLLCDADTVTRTEAAFYLASMMGKRSAELKQRAMLLPECSDLNIWPLQDYFPARLAIPIADAVKSANWSQSGNKAITCAAEALLSRNEPNLAIDKTRQRHWHNLRRDLKLRRFCSKAAVRIHQLALIFIMSIFLGLIAITVFVKWKDKLVIFDTNTLQIQQIDAIWLKNIKDRNAGLINAIENTYPPNANGWERILPWNWITEPLLPRKDQLLAFENLTSLHMGNLSKFTAAFVSDSSLSELNDSVKIAYADLQKTIIEQQMHAPILSSKNYLISHNSWVSLGLGGLLGLLYFVALFVSVPRESENVFFTESIFTNSSDYLLVDLDKKSIVVKGNIAVLVLAFAPNSLLLSSSILALSPTALFIALELLSFLLIKLPWVNNPLISVADDFTEQPVNESPFLYIEC